MKTKYRVIAFAVAALAMLSVLLISLGAAVQPREGYDYSHLGSPKNITLSSADILESYLSEALSEYEREFLQRFGEISLTYSSAISTEKVSVSYDTEQAILSVSAEPYTYTAEDGDFCWVPVSVEYKGQRTFFTEGGAASFPDVTAPDAQDKVSVTYSAEIEFSSDHIGIIENLLYDTAKFLADCDSYITALEEYNGYLHEKRIYDEAKARYDAYLEDLEHYENQLFDYENYENALNEYQTAYTEYLAYLAKLESMQEEIAEYEEYLLRLETVRAQLAAIELTKVKMTDGRTLYSAVLGTTVDTVLENRDLITSEGVGVDEAVVDMAGDATENIRTLLKTYFGKKTEEERYNYYIVNYESFRDNFYNLTKALDKLYQNKKVRAALKVEEKDKKYIILVAQLATVTICLVDGTLYDLDGKVAYNASWKIEGQTVLEILENKSYITDTENAKPLTDGYPGIKEGPELPTEVKKPEKPVRPSKPVEPVAVVPPGAEPEAVPEPLLPIATDAVAGVLEKIGSEERLRLVSMLSDGSIAGRIPSGEPYKLTLVTNLDKKVIPDNVTVCFTDVDGGEIYTVGAEVGSAVIFEGEIPEKQSDAQYEYKFLGWSRAGTEGVMTDLGAISLLTDTEIAERCIRLVPAFDTITREYDITWDIHGEQIVTTVPYGEIPVCPVAHPHKADSEECYYIFAGWTREPAEVTGSTSYTAVFEEKYILPLSNGGASISDDGVTVTAATGTLSDSTFDISLLLDRTAGKRALRLKTIHGDILFSYSDTVELKEKGVRFVSVSATNSANINYKYRISAKDATYKNIELDAVPRISAPCALADNSFAVLFFNDYGERSYSGFRGGADGVISFDAVLGREYTLTLEFNATAFSSELARVSLSKSYATPGDMVNISVELEEGAVLERIIVTGADGSEIKMITGTSFVMPMQDVDIGVVARLKTYVVTFVSDGKTVSTQKVEHGASPSVPTDPTKHNDSLYSYKFLGWSPKIEEITKDTVFSAVYERTRLPEKQKPDGPVISDRVEKILVIAIVCASVAGAATVAGVSIVVYRIVKKRRAAGKAHKKDSAGL